MARFLCDVVETAALKATRSVCVSYCHQSWHNCTEPQATRAVVRTTHSSALSRMRLEQRSGATCHEGDRATVLFSISPEPGKTSTREETRRRLSKTRGKEIHQVHRLGCHPEIRGTTRFCKPTRKEPRYYFFETSAAQQTSLQDRTSFGD